MLAGRENLVPRMLILLSRPRHAIMRHLVVARERLSPLLRLQCAELRVNSSTRIGYASETRCSP